MLENETLEATKDAMPPDAAAAMADRHKKHLARHLAAGHGLIIASQLAANDCMAEDEAGETTPDAEDAIDPSGKELAEKRFIPQSERDKMPAAEFAGPNNSFPIAKPEDITAAAHLIGKADNPDAVKAKIIAIAKKHGWEKYLPAAWDNEATEIPGAPDETEPAKKSFEWLRAGLKTFGILKDEPDEVAAFKVAGNHWIAAWSNNYVDRDGEIFTAKAIDDFVARVDLGVVPLPELWVWHVPGSRIGQAEWVDRHGHFLMAMGTFDATPAGEKARAYYAKHSGSKSLSHGFTFPVSQFDGKHYHQFNSFEISLLPRGAEANLYTSLEGVKEMAKVISEAKKAELFAAFGEEVGARILAAEDAKGKALDELGVASKDFVQPNADEGAANKEAVEAANKAFTALVPDLMEGNAEAVTAALEAVNVAKKAVADVAVLRKELTTARAEIAAIRDGAPRASQSAKTAIKEDDPLAVKSQMGRSAEQESLAEVLPGLFKNG